MTFVAPIAFGLAALSVPIIVLYMLRSRRSRTVISSTLLWDTGEHTLSANAPWQPLRFSWLLFLQLLALLLVVLAIARPAHPTTLPLAEHTVLIIDTSASMQADDHGRSRLDVAKRRAIGAVEQLSAGRRMSVIDAGPTARVVLSGSSDQRALVEAITALAPTDGVTDAAGAFALGVSVETADVPTILHFYSDGGVRPEDRAEAPGTLVHIPIGSPAGNVAITRLAVAARANGWDAYVRLANTGTARADATLSLDAAGAPVSTQPVRLDPQASSDVTVSFAALAGARVTARLSDVRQAPGTAGEAIVNALAVDDTATAVIDSGNAMRVLLVTPGNVFLESLLKSFPGAQVTTSAQPAPARGYTLAIYDRVDPPRALDAPTVVLAAPHGAPGVTVTGARSRPIITFVQPREPILDHVDLSRVSIRSAQTIRAPGLRTLVAAGESPLIATGVPGGRRLTYVGFDLRETNLPVQVAYPLLFGNLFTWLVEGDAPDRATLVAGDALPLRVPGQTERIEVTTPSGARVGRTAARSTFDETERAGFYGVRYLAAGGTLAGEETFAVNVPALESDLVERPITGRLAERMRGAGRLSGLRAWGPGILAVALVVLLLEWWLAHGRPTARHRRNPDARRRNPDARRRNPDARRLRARGRLRGLRARARLRGLRAHGRLRGLRACAKPSAKQRAT